MRKHRDPLWPDEFPSFGTCTMKTNADLFKTKRQHFGGNFLTGKNDLTGVCVQEGRRWDGRVKMSATFTYCTEMVSKYFFNKIFFFKLFGVN